jgi:hypothetical protein
MLRRKLLAGILLIVVIMGCAKKKEQSDTEFSRSSKNTFQSQSSTADIFEEFYKEDTETPESSTPTSTSKQESQSSTAAMTEPQFSSTGRYVVQVSTVGSRTLADRLVEKLEAKGFPAYVAEVQNPTPELFGTYYRVRIGRFAQISAARDFGNETLKPLGYEFWVDNKSNDNVGIEGSGFGETTPTTNFNSGSPYQSYQTYPPTPEQNTPAETYSPIPQQSVPAVDNTPAIEQSAPVESYPPPPSVTPAPSVPSAETAPVNTVAPPATPQTPEVPLDDEW